MTTLVSCDFSQLPDLHTDSAWDSLVLAELLSEIDHLRPKQKKALWTVCRLEHSSGSVKDLAAQWMVSTQRIYQIAAEVISELRQRFKSDEP